MEVSRARGESDDEEKTDARGQGKADSTEEERLREGAYESEYVADKVEFRDLRARRRLAQGPYGAKPARGLGYLGGVGQ